MISSKKEAWLTVFAQLDRSYAMNRLYKQWEDIIQLVVRFDTDSAPLWSHGVSMLNTRNIYQIVVAGLGISAKRIDLDSKLKH